MSSMFKMKTYVCRISICSIILIAAYPVFGQNGSITGTIKNGTTGEPATVESLSLMGFDSGMEVLRELNDVTGNFTLDDLEPSPNNPYLLQVEYKGVTYNTTVIVAEGGKSYDAELLVYEPTNDMTGLIVQEATYQFSLSGGILQILKNYVLMNESDVPKTIVNDAGTFRFKVPETSHGIEYLQVNSGLVPLSQEPIPTNEKEIFAINYPLRPGATQVTVAYHVDYTNKFYGYSEKALYDMHNIVLISAPADMAIAGEGIAKSGGDAHRDFSIFTREHVTEGENLSFTLIGGTPVAIPVSAPKMANEGKLLAIIAIVALLITGTVMSRNKKPVKQEHKRGIPRKIAKRKNNFVAELAALDDRFAENHISEADYHRKRAIIKNQLIELYQKIQKAS